MEQENIGKRNIRKPKRKLNKKRFFSSVALALAVGAGVKVGVGKVVEKFKYRDSIYHNLEEVLDVNDIYGDCSPIDNFSAGIYEFNKDVNVYAKNSETGEFQPLTTLQNNHEYLVYDSYTTKDENDNSYYYCEDSENQFVGLVNIDDMEGATKVGNKNALFSSIFQIDTSKKDGTVDLKVYGKEDYANVKIIKNGEVIFADELDIKYDEENQMWMKARTSDGDIGYIKVSDELKEIKDIGLVQIVQNSNEIIESGNANLSENVENKITDISSGDRLVIIGDGKSKNSSYAIYYDEYGIARFGEISNSLIEEIVDLENFQGFDIESKDINDVISMNQFISEWNENISTGEKGIDISGMSKETLHQLLIEKPDIEYGVVKLGASGYGIHDSELVFAEESNIDMSQDAFEKVSGQVEELKSSGKKVLAYYYATDINESESEQIVQKIENDIDLLGGGITPILDYEFSSSEKEYDRNFWVTKPNYDKYLEQTGNELDFDYIKKLDALALLSYIENHEEVIDYINFCQTEKAKCIAYTYKKLYEDGYITGKNALLYTGNGHFSKDTYKVEIKTSSENYESVVLAKLDEVQDYLTNPQSPYFISEDFNLKVWYADYSGKENDKIFGNDCAMVQTKGDIGYYDSQYDINFACREFIDSICDSESQKSNLETKDEIDDWELE